MHLANYYRQQFRNDLAAVMRALPPMHEFDAPALQPRIIGLENPVIRGWDREQCSNFAASLFITVLTDQVCYTYFPRHYPTFRRLTQYPKWRGDCPGGCHHHMHPEAILRRIHPVGLDGAATELAYHQDDSLPAVLAHEVREFFNEFMPEVDGEHFLHMCMREVPAGCR